MKPLALLTALLLAGCPAAAPVFDVTVTNTTAEVSFLTAGEGSGILMRFEEEIGGTWTGLAMSRAAMCSPVCGSPGPVVCADVAAELRGVWALLAGESETRTFEREWWYQDPSASCIRQTPLAGTVRVEVCHGPTASDENGDPIDEPAASGFLSGGGGADVDDPTCAWTEFQAADGAAIDLE